MPPTVIPSTPGLPLLAFTCRNAAFRFSHSHTSSINRFVLAGFSVPLVTPDDSVSSLPAPRASPVSAEEKSSSIWIFCCSSSLRLMAYWPLLLVRAFRSGRFSLFPSRPSGFTRQRRREVQFDLDILLLVVLETHGLLASPSRSGLRPSFPAWPIHCSAFRHSECLTSLADCHDLICPLLTSAPRSGRLSTASVAEATRSRSPGVSSAAFCAQSPDLRFAPLMDMDFAVSCPLVRRWRLVSGFCPSTRTFAIRFLQTPPRDGSPCVLTSPSPPSGWAGDLHPQAAEHAQHTTEPQARRTALPCVERSPAIVLVTEKGDLYDRTHPADARGTRTPQLCTNHDPHLPEIGRAH